MIASLATFLLLHRTAPLSLQTSFQNPPAWARPHTWWHWMDGNISKSGITADLESMKEAGIGGAQIFDVGQGVPAGKVVYNSPEWRDLMTFAMAEAKRLGLDMTMHNCAGWSSSGGPWVKPDDAMKKVVWSVTEFSGQGRPSNTLPKPQLVRGYFRDIAAIAFPTPTSGVNKPSQLRSRLTGLDSNPGSVSALDWPTIPAGKAIIATVNSEGQFDKELPEGNWTIIRMGYTLTGAQNVATRQSGLGLEVDKLSSDSLDRFFEGGLTPLFDRMGPLVGGAFATVLIDSYETGYNNWTPKILAEFKARRGYDATPYLPAIAGYKVGSDARTLGFLFDYRRTIAELWAQNYSGHFAKRLQARGLKLAIEPYGNGNFDPFTYAKPAGLIMGEYWVGDTNINGSVKEAASVAHVYGHSVVGAEALTASPDQAGFRNQPKQWKQFADHAYALGINRIIYHRFAHQPFAKNVLPGMTMGPWGSHVDRTNTFWSYMSEWDRYLSRCQYMLQSGTFVADICLFPGEDAPQSMSGEGANLPEIPEGFDFDFCGTDPLMSLTVKSGRLMLPSGGSYRVLALPNTDKMTIPLARKVRDLVRAGAIVVGPKPTSSPSLAESGNPELVRIADEVWGTNTAGPGSRNVGKGRIYWGVTLQRVLAELKETQDFSASAKRVTSIHRRIGDVDSYFVAAAQSVPRTIMCNFRVTDKVPELWHPESGLIEDAAVYQVTKTGVRIPISLDSDGSVFVVFRRPLLKSTAPTGVSAQVKPIGSKPLSTLRVIRAEYGVLNQPDKVADVTAQVAAGSDGHNLQINASNADLGGDPAVNLVKELRVTYEIDGQRRTVTVKENQLISVGNIADAGTPPTYQINTRSLLLWQNGNFRVTWPTGRQKNFTANDVAAPTTVKGPWTVKFPAGWDTPSSVTFETLKSWTDSSDFGVKHFSGSVVYSKTLQVPSPLKGSNRKLYLDLGDVRDFARVRLNGKLISTMYKAPYRVDITDVARTGANDLKVEVTNLWVNRLIGDEQFPDDMGWAGDHLNKWPDWFVKGQPRPEPRRKTFTTWRHNTKDTPLLPSGILGPVVLRSVKVVPLGR